MISKGIISYMDETGKTIDYQMPQQGFGGKFTDHSGPAYVGLTEQGVNLYQHLISR